jgi:hypothetical protein
MRRHSQYFQSLYDALQAYGSLSDVVAVDGVTTIDMLALLAIIYPK